MAQDRSGDSEPLIAAWLRLPQPEFGEAVRLLRRACRTAGRDLPREALAARLASIGDRGAAVDGTTVWRWETGVSATPNYRRLLGRVTEVEMTRMGEATRREFLGQLGTLAGWSLLGGAAGLPALAMPGMIDEERLGFAQVSPDRLDQRMLDDLVALTQLYVRQAQAVAPATMLGAVQDLMRRIRWLLNGSHPEATRRRLSVLYAENATMAGRLAFWNDDRGQAEELLKLAGELARDADERHLRAVALAFRADLYSTVPYIGTVPNNTNLALALFNEAAALDAADAPPLLRSWVYGCRAEEFAVLKRPLDSDRDMERAHAALAAAQGALGGDQVVDIAVLDIAAAAAGLSGFEGACAIGLGRAREAREAFEAGLREQSSIGRLSGLAAAYALEGDIESAADLLTRGLDEAVARRLPTRRRRVEGVRAAFLSRAEGHPAVQRFDERLRTAIG
jgi:tetratricopeptide (TPR) repeat protein